MAEDQIQGHQDYPAVKLEEGEPGRVREPYLERRRQQPLQGTLQAFLARNALRGSRGSRLFP